MIDAIGYLRQMFRLDARINANLMESEYLQELVTCILSASNLLHIKSGDMSDKIGNLAIKIMIDLPRSVIDPVVFCDNPTIR